MANTEAAVYTKIRTRFGERISFDTFFALARLNSVQEIAERLKLTKFAESLKGYTYVELHRGKLENILYTHSLFDAYSACMYDKAVGDNLSFLILQEEEIKELISFLCFLKAGKPSEYILNLSLAKNRLAELDFSALARVSSAKELKDFLKGTRYYKYISPALTDDFSVTDIDLTLYKAFYRSAERRIKNGLVKAAADDCLKLLYLKAETEDIALYSRALTCFPERLSAVSPFLIRRPALLTKKESALLFSTDSLTEFMQILAASKYGKKSSAEDITVSARRVFIKTLIKNIHFSSNPFLVLLSYVFYLKEEHDDLKKIIESVRYGLEFEEITKRLNIINSERRE